MSEWLFPDRDVEPDDVDPADVDIRRLDPRDIDPSTNILVAGPAMTGKRRLGVDILSGASSQTACIISTKQTANNVERSFRAAIKQADGWNLSIIDANGNNIRRESANVKRVSGPHDLTGIGIHLSGILQKWDHQNIEGPRVQLHTISTLLMYTDLKRVFRFLHVVLSRMQTIDAVSVFTLDTTSRDSDSFNQLAHLFDAIVEIRERDGDRQFRVRGGTFGPRSWTTL